MTTLAALCNANELNMATIAWSSLTTVDFCGRV